MNYMEIAQLELIILTKVHDILGGTIADNNNILLCVTLEATLLRFSHGDGYTALVHLFVRKAQDARCLSSIFLLFPHKSCDFLFFL